MNKGLSISIDTTTPFEITPNDQRTKKFIGKIIGKICDELYKIICEEAHRLNIYTYEIRYQSKASKIFLAKGYNFEKEDLLRRELLVYFLNYNNSGNHSRFMRSITPLNFDPSLEADYIRSFDSNINAFCIIGELEALYEDEVRNLNDRKSMIKLISCDHLDFGSDNNEDDI